MKVNNFEGQVTRGVPNNGKVDANRLFEIFPGNQTQNHRYSIGGRLGDQALYTAIGDNALETVVAETREPLANLIIGTKDVKLSKVLDLTDADNLRASGISDIEQLRLKNELNPRAYELTQILGNIAKGEGFEGLIVPSSRTAGKNLVLF